MKGKARRLLPALAALLTPALFAGEVNRSWETLIVTLKPGRSITVLQHDGRRAEGTLLTLTTESITVQGGSHPLTIGRDDVFRVRIAGTRTKRALIGLGAGAAAGVAFGANLGSRRHGLSAVVFGFVFGGIGAATGAALPTGSPIYEAPGGLKRAGP
jgi:hypothetical protein